MDMTSFNLVESFEYMCNSDCGAAIDRLCLHRCPSVSYAIMLARSNYSVVLVISHPHALVVGVFALLVELLGLW
jgi:hypothetical protein